MLEEEVVGEEFKLGASNGESMVEEEEASGKYQVATVTDA